jgi:hypothetical protein
MLIHWFLFTFCLAGIAVGLAGAYAQWVILKADYPPPPPVDYTPTDEIAITPNEFGPYCSVFTNKTKSRIGLRLERTRLWGRPPVVWMDARVTPMLADALKKIETTL